MAKRLTQVELIEDFKQFVAATVRTSEISIKEELRADIASLRREMLDGFASICDTFDNHQAQLNRHDRDIKRLKTRFT